MTTLLDRAVAALAPGVLISNENGTYVGLRWPDGFVPPTEGQVRRKMAELFKREKIASVYEARVTAGVAHRGKIIQIDDTSRSNIISMALLAKLVVDATPGVVWPADMANIGWRTRDNSYLPMTAPQMVTMALTAAARFMMLRYRFGALKDAVSASQTAEEIEAIDEASGWGGA